MNIGYCTNVHSGNNCESILQNLKRFAVPTRQQVYGTDPMGIGLWLPDSASKQLLTSPDLNRLKEFLSEYQLVPHTFNAFPFQDFHQLVVKHSVYRPDWTEPARQQYTCRIADVMAELLPATARGTISTLPLGWCGWPRLEKDAALIEACVQNLMKCAQHLRKVRDRTGVHIRVCLEPEPGCVLDCYEHVTELFQTHLYASPEYRELSSQFLGVCHDICHSAVMFEAQKTALDGYRDSEIVIGKVQISSGVHFGSSNQNGLTFGEMLQPFVEARYLHQTTVKNANNAISLFEDLPLALENLSQATAEDIGEARVHFHMPIHLEQGTTQPDISQAVNWFISNDYQTHFEVETYAWEVSPEFVKGGGDKSDEASSLVKSICNELSWLKRRHPKLDGLNE